MKTFNDYLEMISNDQDVTEIAETLCTGIRNELKKTKDNDVKFTLKVTNTLWIRLRNDSNLIKNVNLEIRELMNGEDVRIATGNISTQILVTVKR
jgi:hypothetical protein